MINPFKALGDINALQKMQQMLQAEQITIEKNGVQVVIRGDQKIISVMIDGVMENRITEAINEATHKIHELAARKLMESQSNDSLTG